MGRACLLQVERRCFAGAEKHAWKSCASTDCKRNNYLRIRRKLQRILKVLLTKQPCTCAVLFSSAMHHVLMQFHCKNKSTIGPCPLSHLRFGISRSMKDTDDFNLFIFLTKDHSVWISTDSNFVDTFPWCWSSQLWELNNQRKYPAELHFHCRCNRWVLFCSARNVPISARSANASSVRT